MTIAEEDVKRIVKQYKLYYKVTERFGEFQIEYFSRLYEKEPCHRWAYQEKPPQKRINDRFLYVIYRILETEKKLNPKNNDKIEVIDSSDISIRTIPSGL